jgi:hypothetical protein
MSSPQCVREQRGRELAARLRIVQNSLGKWIVPSDSGQGKYTVDADAPSCSCVDYELNRHPCKHLHAVWFTIQGVPGQDDKQPARPWRSRSGYLPAGVEQLQRRADGGESGVPTSAVRDVPWHQRAGTAPT